MKVIERAAFPAKMWEKVSAQRKFVDINTELQTGGVASSKFSFLNGVLMYVFVGEAQ